MADARLVAGVGVCTRPAASERRGTTRPYPKLRRDRRVV
jgi:hypothetical protein